MPRQESVLNAQPLGVLPTSAFWRKERRSDRESRWLAVSGASYVAFGCVFPWLLRSLSVGTPLLRIALGVLVGGLGMVLSMGLYERRTRRMRAG